MEYLKAKFLNLLFGILCIITGMYAYNESYAHDMPDRLYMSASLFCSMEAAIVLFICGENTYAKKRDRFRHILTSLLCFGVGGYLIYSAITIEISNECQKSLRASCQKFVGKIIAATLLLINGAIYASPTSEGDESPPPSYLSANANANTAITLTSPAAAELPIQTPNESQHSSTHSNNNGELASPPPYCSVVNIGNISRHSNSQYSNISLISIPDSPPPPYRPSAPPSSLVRK